MAAGGELGQLVDVGAVSAGALWSAFALLDRPDEVAGEHVFAELVDLAHVVGQGDDDAVASGGVPDLAVKRVVLAQTEVDAAGNEINAPASVQLVSSMATWAVARSR